MSQLLKRMHPLLCMYPIQVLPAASTNGKKAFGKAYLIAFRKAYLTAFGKDKSFAIYSFTRLIYFVNSLQGADEWIDQSRQLITISTKVCIADFSRRSNSVVLCLQLL